MLTWKAYGMSRAHRAQDKLQRPPCGREIESQRRNLRRSFFEKSAYFDRAYVRASRASLSAVQRPFARCFESFLPGGRPLLPPCAIVRHLLFGWPHVGVNLAFLLSTGDQILIDLKNDYNSTSGDFFSIFEELADENDLKLPRYFINYGKTKDQIIAQLSLQSEDSIRRVIEIIQNRVDQFGVAEPTIQKQGNNRVIVELAGIQDSERARDLLQSTALLELMIVKDIESTNALIRQLDSITATSNEEAVNNDNEIKYL